MALKVIGAGMGRTGTLSLKVALEELGFGKCYHMEELIHNPEHVSFWENAETNTRTDWEELFKGYQSTVDFPGYRQYKKLLEAYPEAKVLLSVRDPEKWYESTYETIFQAGPTVKQMIVMSLKLPFSARLRKLLRVFKMAGNVWKQDFEGKFKDRKYAIDAYHRHIEEVKRAVPQDRLLIYDVSEGWEPLCKFLGVPVPINKPFPSMNDKSIFKQKTREMLDKILFAGN